MNTVLIIESNLEIRENTAELLELQGWNVLVAKDGKLGYQIAKDEKPDIILCDMMKSESNGYGFLKYVKSDDTTSKIPLIFFVEDKSNKKIVGDAPDARIEHIQKPFSGQELQDAIASIM